jgi:predicted MFS family arabinose efflux permease
VSPVLGLGLMLLAVLGLSYARTLILIMLFTIFSSVGRWITDPPLLSLLSDITPLRYQGRSQGIYVVAVDIGIMTGPFAAGISWDHSGPRATFFFLAGIVILALLVTSFLMREREWLNHTATAGYQEPVSD